MGYVYVSDRAEVGRFKPRIVLGFASEYREYREDREDSHPILRNRESVVSIRAHVISCNSDPRMLPRHSYRRISISILRPISPKADLEKFVLQWPQWVEVLNRSRGIVEAVQVLLFKLN